MKNQLSKIEAKLDKLDDRLDKVDVHLAEYNTQLKIHIKRSEQLEDHLKPIIQHVDMMKGAGKLVGTIGLISGCILSVVKVLDLL